MYNPTKKREKQISIEKNMTRHDTHGTWHDTTRTAHDTTRTARVRVSWSDFAAGAGVEEVVREHVALVAEASGAPRARVDLGAAR
jgi:hypothetical protein